MVWSVALAAGGVDAVAMLVDAYPYRETAPVGLALMVLTPWVGGATVALAGRRNPWYLVWPLAAALAAVATGPAYLLGCIVSDILPVPGCFL